mmetsp:Transcript_1746/g.3163  ORF Transcript_1746/g.3163 Transcript_1746/m.3163 type:complete len:292 (-) Transcript_1746:56-931(-)
MMQEPSVQGNNDNKTANGIHIQDALSILSSRAKSGGEKDDLLRAAATPELKQLGQTLDLMNSQQWTRVGKGDCCGASGSSSSSNSSGVEMENSQGQQLQLDPLNRDNDDKKAANHKMKLLQELSTHSHAELISKLFQLQQARVSNYKDYNAGLESILLSGNLSSYPSLTSGVTAAFAVISSSIKDIHRILESKVLENDMVIKNIIGYIQELQMLEKEKLSLTAALHLERIRERNEFLNIIAATKKTEDIDDHRILQLLRKGVTTLQNQISDCVEKINDVLEELRFAALELE